MISRSGNTGRGLTLIELLVAIGIIVILTAFLVPGLLSLQRKSYRDNTESFVKKIETALGLYFNEFRDFPPDGYDREPGYVVNDGITLGDGWPDGTPRVFKGTGSLVYFLCLPITRVRIVGSVTSGKPSLRNIRREKVGPFLEDLVEKNFSLTGFTPLALRQAGGANLARVELVDAWGRPLSYDKVTSRAPLYFQPGLFDGNLFTGNKPHWPESKASFVVDDGVVSDCDAGGTPITEDINQTYDPRRPANAAGLCIDTTKPAAPQNNGKFDLWSRGERWSDPNDDIGTFTIKK